MGDPSPISEYAIFGSASLSHRAYFRKRSRGSSRSRCFVSRSTFAQPRWLVSSALVVLVTQCTLQSAFHMSDLATLIGITFAVVLVIDALGDRLRLRILGTG